jgi:hypothetical protein
MLIILRAYISDLGAKYTGSNPGSPMNLLQSKPALGGLGKLNQFVIRFVDILGRFYGKKDPFRKRTKK